MPTSDSPQDQRASGRLSENRTACGSAARALVLAEELFDFLSRLLGLWPWMGRAGRVSGITAWHVELELFAVGADSPRE